MQSYLSILTQILKNGISSNYRTGVGTIRIPGATFQHSMENGFPLLTTKKMAFKSIRVELEGFIKGITDKQWYKERGCTIWNEWCNPQKISFASESERKQKQLKENDLGKIYGYQWNNFNSSKYNQLQTIIDDLKNNPNSRRMVCSAWNPCELNEMALPPCHLLWQVTVINNTLHLFWYQRSVDTFFGLPFNIASYALLLHLLAKISGYKEGVLTGFLADVHLYNNTIDLAKEQITRTPLQLPTIKTQHIDTIYDWSWDKTKLINYNSHEAIKGQIAV